MKNILLALIFVLTVLFSMTHFAYAGKLSPLQVIKTCYEVEQDAEACLSRISKSEVKPDNFDELSEIYEPIGIRFKEPHELGVVLTRYDWDRMTYSRKYFFLEGLIFMEKYQHDEFSSLKFQAALAESLISRYDTYYNQEVALQALNFLEREHPDEVSVYEKNVKASY